MRPAVPADVGIAPNFSGNRGSAAITRFAGLTWLLGGWTGTGLLNDIWTTGNGAEWTRMAASSEWRPRGFFGAVGFQDRIFILGGFKYRPPSNVIGDVWSSRDGVHWTAAPVPAWEAREHFGVVVLHGKIVLFGGMTYLDPPPSMHFKAFSDVWTSVDGREWSQIVESAPWGGRRGFAFTVFNDRIWLAGGFDGADRLYSDVWSSADAVTWRQEEAAAPWTSRGAARLEVFKGRLWLVGGTEEAPGRSGVNDVWSSPDGSRWTLETAQAPWQGRAGHAMWVERAGQPDERLFVLGGYDVAAQGERKFYGDGWSTADGKVWRLETSLALPDVSPQVRS
jgi:hypothetical protein